jgi:hypothetical protein
MTLDDEKILELLRQKVAEGELPAKAVIDFERRCNEAATARGTESDQ